VAFLVKRELFTQEEIFGRQRVSRTQIENHEVQQIGKEVQPKQAEFHHGPMVLDFDLLLQIGRNLARFQSRR